MVLTDKQLIEEGRRAATMHDRAQMKLGQLCLQFAPIGEHGIQTGVKKRVREYAKAIGMEPSTLLVYRSIAASWSKQPLPDGVHVPYSVVKMLAPVEDKAEVIERLRKPPRGGWTYAKASKVAKEYIKPRDPANGGREPVTTSSRLQVIAQALGKIEAWGNNGDVIPALDKIEAEVERLRNEATANVIKEPITA